MFIPSLRAAVLSVGLLTCGPVGAQTFEVLHSFAGSDGDRPEATLTVGPNGDLYGTTSVGGANNEGVLFKLTTDGVFSVVANFDETTTGANPRARLLNLGDGALYGATQRNQSIAGSPPGTVFKYDTTNGLAPIFALTGVAGTPRKPMALASGEIGALHVLCFDTAGIWRVPLDGSTRTVSFADPGGDAPQSIIRGSDGYLYATLRFGGTAGAGAILRCDPDGTNPAVLYSCPSTFPSPLGQQPIGGLVQTANGDLYGTMSEGGVEKGRAKNGTLFRLTPQGEYTLLHTFTDFRYPMGDLLLAPDGYLYGSALSGYVMATGGIFRIKPDGTGYKALYFLPKGTGAVSYPDGYQPEAGLALGGDGNLYGVTTLGGLNNKGVIFRYKLNLPAPPPNRPPVANMDYFARTDAPLVLNVKANDFDPDNDGLSIRIVQAPTQGTAVRQPGGAILYTPNAAAVDDGFTYEISDGRGGTAIGIVALAANPVPFPAFTPGGYTGLLQKDDDLNPLTPDVPRAMFTVKATSTRKFTGTLTTGRKRFPLRGTFDANGTATQKLTIPGRGVCTLFLSCQRVFATGGAGGPGEFVLPAVQATLFGTELWSGAAPLNTSNGDKLVRPYTVIFDRDAGNPALPVGRGYAAMKVNANGSITASGKLGDGTPFSWSTSLVYAGTVAAPVFCEPYPVGGVVAGLLLRDLVAVEGHFNGDVTWIRNAATGRNANKPYGMGFAGSVEVNAARFFPPAASDPVLGVPQIFVQAGGAAPLPDAVGGSATLDGKRITVAPGGNLKAFTINRATGIMTGKLLVNEKVLPFTGAINRGANTGAGMISIGGTMAEVLLFP